MMIKKIFLIAKNTISEMIRQPIFSVIFYGVGLVISLSPFYTMFAFYDTQKLLIEMGMASITIMSLLVVSLTASHSIYTELQRKTALLILTKPVNRTSFLLGKYLGIVVCGAIMMCFHSLLFLLVIRMGAPETAAYTIDWPATLALIGIFLFSILFGFYHTYFLKKSFHAAAIKSGVFLAMTFFALTGIFDKKWEIATYWKDFSAENLKGLILLFLGMLILASFSALFACLLNRESNLLVTFAVFALGLLSDRFFGFNESQNVGYSLAFHLLPNFQLFQVSDSIVFHREIPLLYLIDAFCYTLLFLLGVFSISIVAFDKMEIA